VTARTLDSKASTARCTSKLRNAIAEVAERQALEHHVGEAAVGGRIAGALARFYRAVRGLRVGAQVEAVGNGGQIELGAVRPDAADAADLTLAQRHREACEVAVLGGGGRRLGGLADAALAAAAARLRGGDHLLLEVGGPDDLAADARAPIEAQDGVALRRAGDAQLGETRPLRGKPGCVPV
jgi:hypothetical protein